MYVYLGSACLEGESTRESTAAAATLASEGVSSRRGEATTTAVHHVEEDVGVDVNVGAVHTTHAAHSSHATHTSHASHTTETAATAEHIGRVHQVIAIIISGTLPKVDVRTID